MALSVCLATSRSEGGGQKRAIAAIHSLSVFSRANQRLWSALDSSVCVGSFAVRASISFTPRTLRGGPAAVDSVSVKRSGNRPQTGS